MVTSNLKVRIEQILFLAIPISFANIGFIILSHDRDTLTILSSGITLMLSLFFIGISLKDFDEGFGKLIMFIAQALFIVLGITGLVILFK